MLAISYAEHATYTRTSLHRPRTGNGLKSNIVKGRRMGSGSNSAVYALSLKGADSGDEPYVWRVPLKDSDTVNRKNAVREFETTLYAAALGVAPVLYDAWYVQRRQRNQRRGLYTVSERLEMNLFNFLTQHTDEVRAAADEIGGALDAHLKALSGAGILTYDLTPSNVVLTRGQPFKVRIIDFGSDFCEKKGMGDTTVIDSITRAAQKSGHLAQDAIPRVMHAVMMVILSVHTAHSIRENRRLFGAASTAYRRCANPLWLRTQLLRQTMTGPEVRLVKVALRHESIRDSLRHYLGGRDASTRRLFSRSNFRCQIADDRCE